MTQVHISGHDHTVTVHHDGADLSYVIDKAQALWDATKAPRAEPGPAYGFQVERRDNRAGFTWKMGEGEQPEVTA